MLTHPVAGPQAWTAVTIDDQASWYYPLPSTCLEVLAKVKEELREVPRSITEIQLPESIRRRCADSLRNVLDALETGRGFAIVEGPRGACLAPGDAQTLYCIVGQGLGRPFVQNVQGALLYDVRDTGQDVAKGARFSVT